VVGFDDSETGTAPMPQILTAREKRFP